MKIRLMEHWIVHTGAGRCYPVEADFAHVDATGALTFSVRVPFWRKRPILTFAAGSWKAYHLSNAYYHDADYPNQSKIIRHEPIAKVLVNDPAAFD
jgi:hypothetical protein